MITEEYINKPEDRLIEWRIFCQECSAQTTGSAETKRAALTEAWAEIQRKEDGYHESGEAYELDGCCCNYHIQITTTEAYE